MKTIQTLIFLFCIQVSFAQTAIIKVVRTNYPEQYKDFDKIIFSFNNLTFSAKDTTVKKIKLNETGFDKCFAVLGKDTLFFITKFVENESYSIRPGCCCAKFTLTADSNAKRGCVRFENKTSRDLWAVLSEWDSDTIKANKTSKYIFANESAMCLFKPAYIMLTEIKYNETDVEAHSCIQTNNDSLWAVRHRYILTTSYFLFLHGEKLTIEYDDKAKKMIYKFDGYMTDEEYKNR